MTSTNLYHLDLGSDAPVIVTSVIEVPRGSANKYEYDPETGVFFLDRVLYSAMHYPGDYGFLPGTLAEDGDPVDVLVLTSYPSFPGMVSSSSNLSWVGSAGQFDDDQVSRKTAFDGTELISQIVSFFVERGIHVLDFFLQGVDGRPQVVCHCRSQPLDLLGQVLTKRRNFRFELMESAIVLSAFIPEQNIADLVDIPEAFAHFAGRRTVLVTRELWPL